MAGWRLAERLNGRRRAAARGGERGAAGRGHDGALRGGGLAPDWLTRQPRTRVAAAQHHGDTLAGMGIGRADADAAASPSILQNLAGWHQPDGLQYV
jgi:hypothetical protein